MDPNDLKNSEELKNDLPKEPEQPSDAVDSTDNSVDKLKKENFKEVNQDNENDSPDKLPQKKEDSPGDKESGKSASKVKKVGRKKKTEEDNKVKKDEVEVEKPSENEKTLDSTEADKEEKPKKPVSRKKVVSDKESPDETVEPAKKENEDDKTSNKDKELKKEEVPQSDSEEIVEEKDKEKPSAKEEKKLEDKPEVKKEVKEEEAKSAQEEKEDIKPEVKGEEKETSESGEKQEKIESDDEKAKEDIDYSKLSQVELINALRDLLEENSDKDIKPQIDAIKVQFFKLIKKNKEDQKKTFIEEGGDAEDFVEEPDPYEPDLKDLLKRYRQIRIEFNKKQEVVKEENLKLKYQVIEEIKNLINNEESINKTFHDFRELQIQWREIGLVPQSKMKDLWETYHFHVENFYNYIKINKELRDLDLKKNLELKIKLCERAEELLVEPSVLKAFNALQKLHERWREIGPVPRDKKDEIWDRFKAATSKINKKYQQFFEDRKTEQKKNLDAKVALCEKAEEISTSEIKSYKEWDVKSKELIELQKLWRTIGFAPRKDNNKIYERFRIACDAFFNRKREFYSKNKELQQNNLQMKIDLCVQAESLKDSTDWKKTTQDFIEIQKKWKEIGPIPRKHSDQVWKRFRAACDFFFELKGQHFSNIDEEQVENLKLKEELIKEVSEYKISKNVDADLSKLKGFQRRWTEIGHVPIKQKDIVQNKFREAINELFDQLKLDDSQRNILKFRNKVSNFSETARGKNKMRLERDKYVNRLKQLENDLILLDNNIGFFTQSKNAESLIADVNDKIEQTKQKIEMLKNKIRVIDEYDKYDE